MSFPRRELGLALVCGGLLMLEICLTKVFSIVLWYHFGFLAVSTALLGFASSGVWLALRREPALGEAADAPIARSAAIGGLAVVASLWLVTQTSFDVYSIVRDRTLGTLVAFVLWVTLPFFFLGLVISRTLAAFPRRAGVLYGADLVGSALGCLCAVAILGHGHSGQTTILCASASISAGGMLFAGARRGPLVWCAVALSVPLVALARVDVDEVFALRAPRSKPYYEVEEIARLRQLQGLPRLRRGVATLRDGRTLEIEVTEPARLTPDGTAVLCWTDDGPRELALAELAEGEDGFAFEPTGWSPYRRWSSLARVDAFHWPHDAHEWGLWGLSRTFYDDPARRIPRQKGITIDAWAMTSITRWSGEPLWPPGTPEVDAERARLAVLEHLPAGTVHRLFPDGAGDVAIIGAGGGLDVLTAEYFGAKRIEAVELNASIVAAVREAFPVFAGRLYDAEAHPRVNVSVAEGRHWLERTRERFDVLQLSGVDTFSTTQAGAFSLSENHLYTVEAFHTFFEHLEPDGVLTLTRWFLPMVVRDPSGGTGRLEPRYSLRLLALTRRALEDAGVAEPARSVFFLGSDIFTVILVKPSGFGAAELDTLHEHCAAYGYDVLFSPREPTPVIPFHGFEFANPLQTYMDASGPAGDAFLAARTFDVAPPVDDKPFFFEVSRLSGILERTFYLNPFGGLTAHGTLLLLLVEVLVLGLLFVVLPLARLRRSAAGGASGGRVRAGILLYFGAIGFGFIVVEIVLSQRFVLFLGHPVYSLAVILVSMLFFSGIGSMLSSRFPSPRFATLLAGGLAVAPVLLLPVVFEACLALPLPARIAIAVAILAPVGLALGIPFPVGLRAVARVRTEWIPWAWAVNGYASVLGSVLAVVLALELGFTTVLLVAGAVYALGAIGWTLMAAGADDADGETEAA